MSKGSLIAAKIVESVATEMMQRRTLLKMAAMSGFLSAGPSRLQAMMRVTVPDAGVRTVLLIAKCHLDVGFTQTQAQVKRRYFDVYFPAAMRIAAAMRGSGGDRYVWTTGSWLLYQYLEQADSAGRRAMEQAIAAGDICWHALPFSWQTEMLTPSMIAGALSLSGTLDSRFGHETTGAKMTDVPGHTRGLVAPLAAGGVRLLDIGVNAASTPPDVPDCFLWKDTAGHSLAVLYHRRDYDGVIVIPGSGVAVDVEVRGDNSGPHTPGEIAAIYAKLRAQFPGAQIRAANMNDVAAAVDEVRDTLPVVTSEIGYTWIYGCASDPVKVARYRELARLRERWITRGSFAVGDATDRKLLENLLLAAEHTWGTDTKTYLDNEHYRPRDLVAVLDTSGYKTMELSWQEKRDDISNALATLPQPLQQEAAGPLQPLQGKPPNTAGMTPHPPAQPVTTQHFELAFDPATGAIVRLRERGSSRDWAGPAHPLALFTYQTLSATEYAGFLRRYITIQAEWAPRDFGKPGIENFDATARDWLPRVVGCWTSADQSGDRVVLELAIDDQQALATEAVAWPRQMFLDASFPSDAPRVDLRLVTLAKVENRMPEAMWLSFSPPDVTASGCTVQKVGEAVQVLDVVRGGGRAMHAVQEQVRWTDAAKRTLALHTLDAPVVALGRRTPLNFSLDQPDIAGGVHVSLFNNAWGTNYPQWCGGDWSFRFRLDFC